LLAASNGKIVWRKDILADNRADNLSWGMSAAPLIVDDKVVGPAFADIAARYKGDAKARERLIAMRQAIRLPAFQEWTDYLMSWLDRRPADMHVKIEGLSALRIQQDPEAIFLEGWLQCEVGAHESGLENLKRAVANGYYAAPTLARSRHFDPLRSHPAFRGVLAQAESGRERALKAFREVGGERLLGQHAGHDAR